VSECTCAPQVRGKNQYRTKISCGTKKVCHCRSSKTEAVDEVLAIGHGGKIGHDHCDPRIQPDGQDSKPVRCMCWYLLY